MCFNLDYQIPVKNSDSNLQFIPIEFQFIHYFNGNEPKLFYNGLFELGISDSWIGFFIKVKAPTISGFLVVRANGL